MPARIVSLSALALPLVTAVGCGDNTREVPPDSGAQIDAGPTDAGSTSTAPGNGFAVVSSDFASSTRVTLLDTTGAVTNPDCLNAGTKTPGVTTTLSGDVVLPSWPQPDHPIVAIDRKNAVLTYLDAATCTPIRQIDVSTKFQANPHDVIGVSATKAYVTRYERNTKPSADPNDFDDGDDLLIINPSTGAITGRIDLSTSAVPLAGKAIQARPDRAVRIEGKIYIALNDITDDFGAMSHGRVVIVDTATDAVTGTIDFPELSNCGGVAYVASTQTLVVTCAGDYNATDPSLTSGLAYVDLTASPPVETKHQIAKNTFGRALSAYTGIANDGTLGFAVTAGVFGGDPKDQLWSLDVAAGTSTKVLDGTDSFIFGAVLIDPGHKQVLMTDGAADLPRVRIYDYTSGTATAKPPVNADPQTSLPPRELAWY